MIRRAEERRKFARAVFGVQSGVEVLVALPGQARQRFLSPLLNLSAGGLAFFLPRPEARPLQVGERLTLERISVAPDLRIAEEIPVEVKGAYSYPNFIHSVYGCEFVTLRLSLRVEIDAFVSDYIAARRQGG
jgi:hypothetical protein